MLGSAKQLSRKQRKILIADFEAADVSAEQLREGAVVAGAGAESCPDLVQYHSTRTMTLYSAKCYPYGVLYRVLHDTETLLEQCKRCISS